jgi:hypothetical protein
MGILDTLSRFGTAKLPNVAGPATNPTAVNTGGLLGGLSRSLFAPGFRDRLALAGAQLQDIEDGGGRARQMQADRQAQEEAAEAARVRQQLNSLAQTLEMTPRERLLFQANPEAWAGFAREAESPFTIGNRRIRNDEVLYEAPEEEDGLAGFGAIPTGMIRDEDGNLRWAEGYVDAQSQLGRVRRRAIVDNPTQPRAAPRATSRAAPTQAAPVFNPSVVRWD